VVCTSFDVPTGHQRYARIFDGITYRAELWVNGTRMAGTDELAGTYRGFEIDVTDVNKPGGDNVLTARVKNPALWWPRGWGAPALHQLSLEFDSPDGISDRTGCDFGIRSITDYRDDTAMRPEFDDSSSFYLKINGRDYFVRGAGYAPELLLTQDRERECPPCLA
jgi:beta-galactosidase/beta-glucuronidase